MDYSCEMKPFNFGVDRRYDGSHLGFLL